MKNKLTLEEMAKLVEKAHWTEIQESYFHGIFHNDTLRIDCERTGDCMLFWWGETARISVYAWSDEKKPYHNFGSYQGKQVFPLYERIQQLAKKDEKLKEINCEEAVDEVRKKYLGGQ